MFDGVREVRQLKGNSYSDFLTLCIFFFFFLIGAGKVCGQDDFAM